ncbi:MAG: DUF1499 domain-containing protein [Gammaproteobacteria bacterium]
MTLAPASAKGDSGASLASALAWVGLALAVACGVAELMAGPGYRYGWWGLGVGIQIIRWGATIAAAAALGGLAAIILAALRGPRGALGVGVVALAVSLAALGPPAWLAYRAKSLPAIHDVTTDTANPPRFVAVLPLRKGATNSTDYSADTAARQKQGYPDIVPAMLDVPADKALQLAERAALAMGWSIVAVAPQDGRIEATATTPLFGFKDDIVVRVTPEGGGSRVDVRSLSRVGRSDFGVNADRIRAFMKQLQAERARS